MTSGNCCSQTLVSPTMTDTVSLTEALSLTDFLEEYAEVADILNDPEAHHEPKTEADRRWMLAVNVHASVDDRLGAIQQILAATILPEETASVIDEAINLAETLLSGTTESIKFALKHFPLSSWVSEELLKDSSVQLTLLRGLAILYGVRSSRTEDLKDLNMAISLRERCLASNDEESPRDSDHAYLCGLLTIRFQDTETFLDIESAIQHGRSSLYYKQQHHPIHVNKYGAALSARYHFYRNEEDLDDLISLLREAVDSGSSSELLPTMKNNLVSALVDKLPTAQEPLSVANECLRISREIIQEASADDHMRPIYLYNLAAVLRSRAGYTKDIADIDEAIEILRSQVDCGSDYPPTLQALFMAHLGFTLHHRYQETDSWDDLNISIAYVQKALDDFPHAIAVHIGRIKATLFQMYFERFKQSRNPTDLDAAVRLVDEVDPTCLPSTEIRIAFAIISAGITHSTLRYDAAIVQYRMALELLPRYLMLGKQYRIHILQEYGAGDGSDEVGVNAAAACIALGRTDEALELLEAGRSIGWSRGLHLRTGLDLLEARYPDHARRLKELNEMLEKAGNMVNNPHPRPNQGDEHLWESHFNTAKHWDVLVGDIQKLDGFKDFLRSPSYDELKHVCQGGPIVVVNLSPHRSDALIIATSTLDRPQIVKLPDELYHLAKDWSNVLREGIRQMEDGTLTESQFSKFTLFPLLGNIWTSVVKPVRVALQTLAPYAQRMWWCPTGRLTFLPLHLVINGIPKKAKGNALLPSLIPSYTTTIDALLRSRAKLLGSPKCGASPTLLAASCELSEGHKRIAGTTREVNTVTQLFADTDCGHGAGSTIDALQGSAATVTQVLSSLSTHTWVHLACHGFQSTSEPFKSYLALADGKLFISDITNAQLESCQFAFLSACHTAVGIPTLSEEAMHFAAGLHFAGFLGTVATMWSIRDRTARRLAKQFYKVLLTYRQNQAPLAGLSIADASRALWEATNILLKEGVPVSQLAPFIHTGV